MDKRLKRTNTFINNLAYSLREINKALNLANAQLGKLNKDIGNRPEGFPGKFKKIHKVLETTSKKIDSSRLL